MPLPYCGEGADDQCCAVVLNHQMFTQCTHRVSGKFTTEGEDSATTLNLCKGCFKGAGTRTKAGNKALLYGAIAERLEKGCVIGNNGALRKPVTYANVMAKLSITEEQAVAAADKLGWTIPDEELHPVPVARGRPKKEKMAAVEVVVDTSDSGSDGEKTAAKKRGRPKKQKKVMSSAQGDDLIASLVEEAQQTGAAAATSDEEATAGSDTSAKSTVSKSDQKKSAAAEKKAAAEAAKLVRAAELATKKEEAAALVAAAMLGKQVAAEEKKAARLLAAAQKKEAAEAKKKEKADAAAAKKKEKSAPPPPAADELEEEAEEDEEATQVVKWTCPADEKEYLKSADNVVYDAENHDAVGVWNEKENKIDELPAEEGEGEEE